MPEIVERLYPWKRFWCPWDKPISFADDGFVYDPESDFGTIFNRELRTLDCTQQVPCLILLGEPGLGKSQSLREYLVVLESAKDSSRQVIYLDLKDFGSDAAITRGLFESRAFQQWKDGEEALYLLIDSFDEVLLTIESLSGYLTRELRALAVPKLPLSASPKSSKPAQPVADRMEMKDTASSVAVLRSSPVNRLFLRIACRPAVWPSSLTSDLRGIFSEQGVAVWRLAPLRKRDVEVAAARNGVGDFTREVISRGVVSFATKPITLKALLNLYKSNRALPDSKYDIYEELCRVACTESSASRRERQKTGRLTPQERVSVAARIAALMVFCNRSRLRTDLPLGDLADEELPVDVIFGHERQRNGEFVVNHQIFGRDTRHNFVQLA